LKFDIGIAIFFHFRPCGLDTDADRPASTNHLEKSSESSITRARSQRPTMDAPISISSFDIWF